MYVGWSAFKNSVVFFNFAYCMRVIQMSPLSSRDYFKYIPTYVAANHSGCEEW